MYSVQASEQEGRNFPSDSYKILCSRLGQQPRTVPQPGCCEGECRDRRSRGTVPAAAVCAASPDCERPERAARSRRLGRRRVGPVLAEGGGEGWGRGVLAVWGEKGMAECVGATPWQVMAVFAVRFVVRCERKRCWS
ncbi:unnamed protein product [Miscanthus lutarioriparius]|uniref:Uncharacterized protein n=1 Tax=Miscanthus lutarioriparius TaxID=422564 RepID=A0A811N8K6_9POAL|nr:unnamed protein product [Miscanthus lutarioriparius]